MRRMGTSIRIAGLVAILSVAAFVAIAPAHRALQPTRGTAVADSLLGNPLIVPGVDLFVEGQSQAADSARRASPEAVAARARSRIAYGHLAPRQVSMLLRNSFPVAIKRPAGAQDLPVGAHIVGYPSAHAAQLALPGHRVGILESSWPVAKRGAHGGFAPIDLALKTSADGYAPTRSSVSVRIPRDLSTGVRTPQNGVTLIPVDPQGRALSGRGVIDHSSVVYANTQQASDTVVKPTPTGFQIDDMLRSFDSPQRLLFRVDAPSGATLVKDPTSESVRVSVGGATLATILPPAATDSAGTPVPASMSTAGTTVTVDVPHQASSYLYPIDVDPEINDSQLAETSGGKHTNWEFKSSNEARFGHKAIYEGPGKEHLETTGTAEYGATEFAYWAYETKGNSKIYELKAKTSAKNKGAKIESFLQFQSSAGTENRTLLSTEGAEPEYSEKVTTICGWNASKAEECLSGSGKEKNTVRFQQSATGSPGANFKFSDTLNEGVVSISEPSGEHSTTSFNTTSPEVEGEVEVEGKKVVQKRTNVLYGAGIWLTKFKGALQFIAKDPGIGVSATRLEYEKSGSGWEQLSSHNYLENENGCKGVQCYQEHREYWTVDPKLPDGEDKIRYRAEEAIAGTVSLTSEPESTKTVKVDTTAPHGVSISGLPWGNELSEKPYKLSAQAVDGSGSTVASSGIDKLALFVSGHEVAELGTQTGCAVPKGECTAKAEWSLNGAELGAGHHAIVVVAIDKAGNESRLEETISIRHSTPVALGPGSVDLQSGDFTLAGSDVAMGSGLTVGRDYSSRATEAGMEGSFGPQWTANMGTTESVQEMVDGSLLLTDATGKQVIFARTESGDFEAPMGDSNLELSLEENKVTKEKLAYHLNDAAKHTKTTFTKPAGDANLWVPTRQEGSTTTDTTTYEYQTAEQNTSYPMLTGGVGSITDGPDKNLWIMKSLAGKIGKMTTSGVVTEFSLPSGTESYAYGVDSRITTGSDGNLWFTRPGLNKVGKATPSGSITEYSPPTGSEPTGIIAGPDGKAWFTDTKTGKIGKITSSGIITEYSLPAGSGPTSITAGPDGNLWFTAYGPNRIGKITTEGVVTEYSYPLAFEGNPSNITTGPGDNLWFMTGTPGRSQIGEITTSGTVTEYTIPSSFHPYHIAEGPDKNLWVTDSEPEGKIGKLTAAGAFTEYHRYSPPSSIVTGPDGNLWFTEWGTSSVGTITTNATVTEPTVILASAPGGVSCSPELKQGCRALKFTYANGTSASGEGQSEWGKYRGRLEKVLADVYNPTSKKMQETAVSEYSYDKLGRLRAQWDPRISPALKTTYGYDEEGHVTALNPPGQEPWAFTYGTSAGDSGAGRLLKVMRSPASEAIWGGTSVKNTETPTISGAPVVGVRMAVSNGKWSGAPITYGYQWMRCGTACTPILGATNANYTPTNSDVGDSLIAVVTATNGGGSASISVTSGKVEQGYIEYSLPPRSAPTNITAGPDGKLWFTDLGTAKVGKITTGGEITEYSAELQDLEGITSGPDGKLWFVGHPSVNDITTLGALTVYHMSRTEPGNMGIVAGSDGNLWFTEEGKSYIGRISTNNVILGEYALPAGSRPDGIAAGPDGNLWFANGATSKIGKITTSGSITEYSLPTGSDPFDITAGPDGNLWFTELGTSKLGKITTSGSITEYALAAASQPRGIASVGGKLYVTEFDADKVARVTTAGAVTEYSLPTGSKPNDIAAGPDGNLWIAARSSSKILKFTAGTMTEGEAKTPASGFTLEYGAPLSATGLPTMTSGEVAKWGQTDVPVEGTAIIPPDSTQGWPASSYTRATTYYLDAQGRTVNVSKPSNASYGSVATTEFNEFNDQVRTLTPDNRQKALEAGSESADVAKSLSTYFTYREECSKESENKHEAESAPGARLCETEGPQHQVKYMSGSEQKESLARLHTKYFYDESSPGGATYNLVTKTSSLAELANEEEVEVRKTITSYSGQSGLGWTLRAPTSVTVDPEGKKLTTTTLYNSATGQVTETRAPAGGAGGSAHDVRSVYYSAGENTEGYPACGSHPEWASLLCETLPAKQPSTGPKLPVVTTTYNIWNEPETITETFGSTVRTKKEVYDGAGRLTGSETTSTANTALPKVTDEYNSKTGILEKQSTTVEAKTKTLTSVYNTLGELTEYTDADGNITKYRYAGPENDWLLEEVADGSAGGTGKQTYSYNSRTKLREELTDSAAGVFSASYDAEGKLVSEVYPNAMCAKSSYNAAGEPTHLEYIKTSNCSESSPTVWYSETRNPAVRGETFARSSTLANETYAYDTVGRLTEAHETPAGEGCRVRLYGYDEESNRTSQTTRVPGGGGSCATEGGTVLGHTYNEANRLTDTGVAYDSFANVTNLPAADAEGHELSSTFYVDNAVATQSQNGVSNSYYLDPEGRVRETTSGANVTTAHYDGSGEAVAWTSETGGKSTRNIPGIDGTLAAAQTNGGTPVLQLHDLQGDVVATAALSPTETKLLSTYNSTEFGVPNAEKTPPKFAWLGAADVASAFSSGVVTYGSTSYVPQIGRMLQSETVEPPGAPHGSGAGAPYSSQEEPWVFQGAAAEAAEAPGLEAARELAAEEAALRAAMAAGGDDPTAFFSQKKAIEVGKELNAVNSWSEVWNIVFGLMGLGDPEGAAIAAVVGVVTVDEMKSWLHNTGGKLEQCGKIKESWVSGCELKFKTVLGSMIDWNSTSEVEKCGTYFWYAKKFFGKDAWECRRLNERPGPV